MKEEIGENANFHDALDNKLQELVSCVALPEETSDRVQLNDKERESQSSKSDDLLDTARISLQKVSEVCNDVENVLNTIRGYGKRRESTTILLEDINKLSKMQMIEADFQDGDLEKKELYGELYQGVATDWGYIDEQIGLAAKKRYWEIPLG